MSNAKKLLFLLCIILAGTGIIHVFTDCLPYAFLSLSVCPAMLYLAVGFCNECYEYGPDCTCNHGNARGEA